MKNDKLKYKILIIPLIFFGLFGLAKVSFAATINAASCSQADVTTAYNASSDGDVLVVPAGDCSSSNAWSGYITILKQLTVKGAGIGNTIIGISTWASGFMIKANNVRITGFTFDGKYNNAETHGLIYVGDDGTFPTLQVHDFRIDHNRFINTSDNSYPPSGVIGQDVITVRGYSYGVIDHNTFEDPNGESVDICADGPPGLARPIDFGDYTNGTVYVENNTWNYSHAAENAIDGNSASRYVFRYNTINMGNGSKLNGMVSDHELCATCTCGGAEGDAGSVLMEVYGNTINNNRISNYGLLQLVQDRSGKALIYNNTVYGADVYGAPNTVWSSVYRANQYSNGSCGSAAHGRGYSAWCHDPDAGYTDEGRSAATTTITSSLGTGDQSVSVTNVNSFPTYGGSIIIGGEQIDYMGISGLTLTGCTRGANGTTATSHPNGASVDLLIFGACLEQVNNTWVWGNNYNDGSTNHARNGVALYASDHSYLPVHNDYTAYDIQSYAVRPQNWQYRNDGTAYSYTPYPYPHPLTLIDTTPPDTPPAPPTGVVVN
ncbi:MAG: hypothetical protein ABR875_00600 [Minisyncoccia bacterium]